MVPTKISVQVQIGQLQLIVGKQHTKYAIKTI